MTRPNNANDIRAFSLKPFDQAIIDRYAERKGIKASRAVREILCQWNEAFFFLEECEVDDVQRLATD